MNTTGIICEFNPFHNGHKFLFDSVRQALKPDALVCVMSGNFVQRGEPAMWDKYKRARAAVLCGADLVIELPVIYSLSSAADFASGGIKILKGLGTVDTLAFGSECGDASVLNKISSLTACEDDAFSASVKASVASGLSYPAAYLNALRGLFPDVSPDFFASPNNILALEYLKQNIRQNAGFSVFTVKRTAAGHDSIDTSEFFASGMLLREKLSSGCEDTDLYIPGECKGIFSEGIDFDEAAEERLWSLIRYKISTSEPEILSAIKAVSEGLENRIIKALPGCNNRDELIKNIKSKRYTYARISRMLIQMLLDISCSRYDSADAVPYARVLAFNQTGRKVIRAAQEKGSIPVITNPSKNDDAPPGLKLDFKASELYSIICGKSIYQNSDMVCNSQFINI